jgi:hypothetical protein
VTVKTKRALKKGGRGVPWRSDAEKEGKDISKISRTTRSSLISLGGGSGLRRRLLPRGDGGAGQHGEEAGRERRSVDSRREERRKSSRVSCSAWPMSTDDGGYYRDPVRLGSLVWVGGE